MCSTSKRIYAIDNELCWGQKTDNEVTVYDLETDIVARLSVCQLCLLSVLKNCIVQMSWEKRFIEDHLSIGFSHWTEEPTNLFWYHEMLIGIRMWTNILYYFSFFFLEINHISLKKVVWGDIFVFSSYKSWPTKKTSFFYWIS